MFDRFYPKEYVSSAYRIDFDSFVKKGYKGVIFDIDNTLVPHGTPADDNAKEFFAYLKELGLQACLLSNNDKARVDMFNEEIQVCTVPKGGKPASKGYRRAMELMGTDEQTTLFVGDQIFTDVYGANLAGIYSILVKPIDTSTDEIQIVVKRQFEKIVLNQYKKDRKKKI